MNFPTEVVTMGDVISQLLLLNKSSTLLNAFYLLLI
jgi:hypothetical protein